MSPRGETLESVHTATPEVVHSEVEMESNPFAGLSEEGRINTAQRYGLPETATWQEISVVAQEQNRLRAAKSLGLPESTTMADIKSQGPEIHRVQRAREYGLDDDATWEEIMIAKDTRGKVIQPGDLEAAA